MGDMADLFNDCMEKGKTVVRNNATGEEIVVENIELMYGNWCKEPKYTILGEDDG